MKYLLCLLLTALTTFAWSVKTDVFYTNKYFEKGVSTIEDTFVADISAQVASFGGGARVFALPQDITKGVTRVDVYATYQFKSTLADLDLGLLHRAAKKEFAFNDIKNATEPFISIHGNAFKRIPWEIKGAFDIRNRTNNFEATVKLPLGWNNGVIIVPELGLGANDPGAVTLDLLRHNKTYFKGGAMVVYPLRFGAFYTNVQVVKSDFSVAIGYKLELQ